MAAKSIQINLLGTQDLEHTPWGRVITWATTYGRYIMITTEIVVLLAFISRFSLDRKNTDLTEELAQKQAILEANQEFEMEIKSLQKKLDTAKKLYADQARPIEVVNAMENLIPADVFLTAFELTSTRLVIAATAGSTQGFAQFLSNLQSTKSLQNVMLADINKTAATGIEFRLTADIVGGKK